MVGAAGAAGDAAAMPEDVAAAVEGPVTSMITASALQLHRDIMFIIDREAASALENLEYYEWIQAKMPDAP